MSRKLTDRQQAQALAIVALWLGPRMGHGPYPAPTGSEAAHHAEGPVLVPDWDWPDQPTPTILLEGGPYDWAYEAAADSKVIEEMRAEGIFCEPFAGYALCLYPAI